MRFKVSLLLVLLPITSAHSTHSVPVFLTHFYVALDQATYDAMLKSPEIAALAAVEEKHVTAGGESWTGFYVTGRQTYMEFFTAGALQEGMRVGDCGLALTVEESGGVAEIADRLRTRFGDKVEVDTTPAKTDTGMVPWFQSADLKANGPQVLSTWFMEIDPGFLAAIHPGAAIEHPLSRQQYMSWKFLPDHPLDDVVALTLRLTKADRSQLAAELELAGWKVAMAKLGFLATGPDIKVTVAPATGREGIQLIEMRLRKSVPKQDIVLGTAKLHLEHSVGHLIFWTDGEGFTPQSRRSR
jgi:Family of unknown function (DUF5829)